MDKDKQIKEMSEDIKYYVIRNKVDGMYFRGKGVNRWGKYFNQATIYRIKGTAESSLREILLRRNPEEDPEVLQIDIRIVNEPKPVGEVSFYTPEDVRAMSSKEVRENYTRILQSMRMWN
jgi:hypothetical protein